MLQKLLTEKEAATYIGMSQSYLRQARVTGCLPNRTRSPKFTKIGKSVRYRVEDLDDFIEGLGHFEHLAELNTRAAK